MFKNVYRSILLLRWVNDIAESVFCVSRWLNRQRQLNNNDNLRGDYKTLFFMGAGI